MFEYAVEVARIKQQQIALEKLTENVSEALAVQTIRD